MLLQETIPSESPIQCNLHHSLTRHLCVCLSLLWVKLAVLMCIFVKSLTFFVIWRENFRMTFLRLIADVIPASSNQISPYSNLMITITFSAPVYSSLGATITSGDDTIIKNAFYLLKSDGSQYYATSAVAYTPQAIVWTVSQASSLTFFIPFFDLWS